jgi:RNA polymerase sigma-70 factor (ECF subfamily)
MTSPGSLAHPFFQALSQATSGAQPAQQEAEATHRLLIAMLAEASAEWPQLKVIPETFAAYVAARIPPEEDPVAALGAIRGKDLALAHACAQGDPVAMALFEAGCFTEVDGALRRMRLPIASLEDVKQALRARLFVRDGDDPPLIEKYSGRGDLRAWVRVTALRSALRLARKGAREALTGEDALFDLATPTNDPELDQMKRIYRSEFKRAFESAIQALPNRDQTLLKQHYMDGLSLDEVARLYQVHRATAARWLARARELVLSGTRERIIERVRVSDTQLDSIMRLVRSSIHVSMGRVLASQHEKDE